MLLSFHDRLSCWQRPSSGAAPAFGLRHGKLSRARTSAAPSSQSSSYSRVSGLRCASLAEQRSGEAAVGVLTPAAPSACRYAGVVFDMDGTLTVSNIDFQDMRQRTGIPAGDLFTVMESWDEGDRIRRSMDVILELEAKAASDLEIQPGLLEVLAFLKDRQVKVGLVTRNTEQSVDAFFDTIGQEWRPLFDPVLTREFKHVKPDPRALKHFAEVWDVPSYQLLMVGDSTEDVETGNAAGTATCLIAGGGNEVAPPPAADSAASSSGGANGSSDGGSAAAPPPPPPPPPPAATMPAGAVPSFVVHTLGELLERLEAGDTALGWGAPAAEAAASAGPGTLAALRPGAPPPGVTFLDYLFTARVVAGASCSFPRIIISDGDVPDEHPGDHVLHFGCGDGALTKLLFSSGLQVVGVDADVSAAQRRGLKAVSLPAGPLTVAGVVSALGKGAAQGFDALVFFGALDEQRRRQGVGMEAQWDTPEALAALAALRKPTGRLCAEGWVEDGAALRSRVAEAGLTVQEWQELSTSPCGLQRIRLVAA